MIRYWKQAIVVFFWLLLIAGYITYASIHKLNPLEVLRLTAHGFPITLRVY